MMSIDRRALWHSLFIYDSTEGQLLWKETASPKVAGKVAGYLSGKYLFVRYEGKAYALHKVVYEMHFGSIETPVDHIDQNKLNNRIENLRAATKSQNEANTGKRSTNTSGYKGVYWLKNANKWRAKIDHNKKQIHIGLFTDKNAAAIAYNQKATELFGEHAFLNEVH